MLRYDNAHERTSGHDRHAPSGVEDVEFPGMVALLERFQAEVDDLPPSEPSSDGGQQADHE